MMTRGNENEDENEDGRDTQPILSRETVPYSDDGGSSSSEAGFLLGDIALVHTGLKITGRRDEDNESVNVDQPQCRICLDTGGNPYSSLIDYLLVKEPLLKLNLTRQLVKTESCNKSTAVISWQIDVNAVKVICIYIQNVHACPLYFYAIC